jgi:hypothetical protein
MLNLMNDLMAGYYIISGILFFFLFGSVSIVCDMFLNQEEKEIVIKKRATEPESSPTQFLSDDYQIDDDLFDN